MSKSTFGWRRAGIATLATSSLVVGSLFAGVGAANADANFEFERVNGHTRYDVSANAAGIYGASDTVILASGETGKFGDALTANFLAGDIKAPILLTELDETPAAVLEAIEDAGATKIIIVGGPLSVSEEQEAALAEDYDVERIEGRTRYDVAADIIDRGTEQSDTALVATGEKFPDALAAGPVAYAAGMPLAITERDEVPAAVMQALEDADITKAVVLGGDLSVSEEVRDQLRDAGITLVEEFAGADRAEVSTMMADYAIEEHGFTNARVNAATGREFSGGADALSAGPVSGKQERPIVITAGDPSAGTQRAVGQHLLDWLEENARTLTGKDNLLFGGPLSITEAMKDLMEEAAQTVTTNQSYVVNGGGETVDEGSDVEYTVTGLAAGQQFTIALADAANVTVADNGTVTFDRQSAPNAGHADFGSVVADITEVDGVVVPTGGQTYTGTVGEDGTVTFTISGDNNVEESVVPVLFKDDDAADGRTDLDVNASGEPTEEFGVGDATVFATVASVQATPDAIDRPFGAQHTVTAQLLTSEGAKAPRAGEDVVFEVRRQIGAQPAVVLTETVKTDATGTATFTYTGPNDPNPAATSEDEILDSITAYWDENRDGVRGDNPATTVTEPAELGDTVTVNWVDDAPAATNTEVTAPEGTTAADPEVNLVGTRQLVAVEVTDQFGDPAAGEEVTFTITGANPTTVERTTDASGVASFTYQGNNAGPDTINIDVAGIGTAGSVEETAYVDWSEGVATVDGSDYATLAEAIAAADAGDTITARGTFAAGAEVNKDGIMLQGVDATVNAGLAVRGDDVTIDGFEIVTNGIGINVLSGTAADPTTVTITNNTITGNSTSQGIVLDGDGAVGAAEGVVDGNTIDKVTVGVVVSTAGAVDVTDNAISNFTTEGIGLASSNTTVTGNTLTIVGASPDVFINAAAGSSNAYLDGLVANNTYSPAAEADYLADDVVVAD